MSKFLGKEKFLAFIFLGILLLFPLVGFGQEETNIKTINYVPLETLPGLTEEGENLETSDLSPYLSGLFDFLVGLAVILAVFVISLGGFIYMSSDSFTGKSTGKDFIWNAVEGLLIVLGAYIILYTINPNILRFNLRPGDNELPPDPASGQQVNGNTVNTGGN